VSAKTIAAIAAREESKRPKPKAEKAKAEPKHETPEAP
jgi:hypothetical protein